VREEADVALELLRQAIERPPERHRARVVERSPARELLLETG